MSAPDPTAAAAPSELSALELSAQSGPQLRHALDLRALTSARVALDRTGVSLTTRHALEFALAHAQARDAVRATLDVASMLAALRERELAAVSVRSAAGSRTEYLRRPDLGRTLATESCAPLFQFHRKGGLSCAEANDRSPSATQPQNSTALTLILADGLSATAANRHAVPLLDALLPLLRIGEPNQIWRLTPVVVAEQARVALGDQIGVALGADITVVLIGERPGLSSPDSLGAYITWGPRVGRSDAGRNCVSNIRGEGLDYATAARKIAWYVSEGRRLGLTGVALRESETALLPEPV
jgi:ethanolamine ammonia-lyase small subunit